MSESLTTLQLARRIADAAVIAYERADRRDSDHVDDRPDHEHPPTQAVLRTLHETGSWFCRLSENAAGVTVQEPYDVVQANLFP